MAGYFIVRYHITTGAAGAPVLDLRLGVDTAKHSIGGRGTITQAINPPLDNSFELEGIYHYTGLGGTNIVVALHTPPHLIGGATVQIALALANWEKGSGSYFYRDLQGHHIVEKDVPVKTEEWDNHAALEEAKKEAAVVAAK